MPVLPSSLSPVQVAVAALLHLPGYSSCLYLAKDIANTLNSAISADDDPSINTWVDVTTLLRAFTNNTANKYVLNYDEFFHYRGGRGGG